MTSEHSLGIFPSSVELTQPVEITSEQQIAAFRQSLIEAGCNLDINDDQKEILQKPQLRDLESGRGPAIAAILGKEKADKFFPETKAIAEKHGNTQSFPSSGKGLGLRQAAAELFELVTLPISERTGVINSLNQRIYLGASKTATSESEKRSLNIRFANTPPIEEPLKKAYVKPGELMDLINFLTSK